MQTRIDTVCDDHKATHEQGGLNVSDIKDILREEGHSTKGRRRTLVRRLCKFVDLDPIVRYDMPLMLRDDDLIDGLEIEQRRLGLRDDDLYLSGYGDYDDLDYLRLGFGQRRRRSKRTASHSDLRLVFQQMAEEAGFFSGIEYIISLESSGWDKEYPRMRNIYFRMQRQKKRPKLDLFMLDDIRRTMKLGTSPDFPTRLQFHNHFKNGTETEVELKKIEEADVSEKRKLDMRVQRRIVVFLRALVAISKEFSI